LGGFTAVVMAGHRGGGEDPLAKASGAAHRALLDICGVPMLVRVVRALRASRSVEHIVVSIGEPEALRETPELAALLGEGALEAHRSLDSPSRSALDVLDRVGSESPILVTTADHPLLTPAIVDHFVAAAERSDADLLVGAVAGRLVRERYPSAVRTWVRLRDGDWSGANLFALRTPAARRAVEFWTRVDSLRKQPWRLVRTFGLATLALFLLRRLDLESGLARVSKVMGVRVDGVPLPFPEAAIDVDRQADLELVRQVLGEGPAPEASVPQG
jgi:GTP:adenosylcobinamide-phosphate guanylyltransferase